MSSSDDKEKSNSKNSNNKKKEEEMNYEEAIDHIMIGKYMALSSMDYMDEECDTLIRQGNSEEKYSPINNFHFLVRETKTSFIKNQNTQGNYIKELTKMEI